MASVLLQTIETDLKAGASYLESGSLEIGTFLWNVFKTAFIALEPLEAQILKDVLTAGVTAAAGGQSIEQIETSVLNTATSEQKAVLAKAGSSVVQTIIAGIKTQS